MGVDSSRDCEVCCVELQELLAEYLKEYRHDPKNAAARRTLNADPRPRELATAYPLHSQAQLQQFAQHRGHNVPFRAAAEALR